MKIHCDLWNLKKHAQRGKNALCSMYIPDHAKLGHLPDDGGKKPPPGHFYKWIGGGYMH